ncbi:MAG: hypothetical protein OXG87_04550 [Gemmatimonadetes bacterium]|nr:hypothetical protein [Gemmatimonadota bacterium]
MDLTKFQDGTILAEWMLSEAEQGEHTYLPREIGDWNSANEIRAEIHYWRFLCRPITTSTCN